MHAFSQIKKRCQESGESLTPVRQCSPELMGLSAVVFDLDVVSCGLDMKTTVKWTVKKMNKSQDYQTLGCPLSFWIIGLWWHFNAEQVEPQQIGRNKKKKRQSVYREQGEKEKNQALK